jgi:hypothetical protein
LKHQTSSGRHRRATSTLGRSPVGQPSGIRRGSFPEFVTVDRPILNAVARFEYGDDRAATVLVGAVPDVDRFQETGWADLALAFVGSKGFLGELARTVPRHTVSVLWEPTGEIIYSARVRGRAAVTREVERCHEWLQSQTLAWSR